MQYRLSLLQAAGGIPQELVTPIMLALMFGVFYFFIIRPQSRRQKRQAEFEAELKRGQDIVTSSGIVGKVAKYDKDGGIITVETGKNVQLNFTVGSISRELTEAKFGSASDA